MLITLEQRSRHDRFERMVLLLLSGFPGWSIARALALTGCIPYEAIAERPFEILEQAQQFSDWYGFPHREVATGRRIVPEWMDLSWFPENYDAVE